MAYARCVDAAPAGDHGTTMPPVVLERGIMELASKLTGPGLIPETAEADAVHVAAAAISGCRYLLTWNFRHIANAAIRHGLERVLAENGYRDITICTADELAESETVGG